MELVLIYYPSSCLEGLRITPKLSQDSRYPNRDLNPGPPEFEVVVLSSWPLRAVKQLSRSRCKPVITCRSTIFRRLDRTATGYCQLWRGGGVTTCCRVSTAPSLATGAFCSFRLRFSVSARFENTGSFSSFLTAEGKNNGHEHYYIGTHVIKLTHLSSHMWK
jgi:hypothetical protein